MARTISTKVVTGLPSILDVADTVPRHDVAYLLGLPGSGHGVRASFDTLTLDDEARYSRGKDAVLPGGFQREECPVRMRCPPTRAGHAERRPEVWTTPLGTTSRHAGQRRLRAFSNLDHQNVLVTLGEIAMGTCLKVFLDGHHEDRDDSRRPIANVRCRAAWSG